ncbi:hypothetical protein [Companilactobacillus mishanensis]|uniref:hypothetical protein n=1 Tax=Companilactobacillus mishanensis TaxID=2486008 RepID=UPI001561DEF0|nr:hypothetical protein [Companilactobacillus mishanensis]
MRGKKLRFLMVALFAVLLIFGFSGKHDNASKTENKADAAVLATVPGYGTPSADPISIFFVNFTTGYSLQPQDQFTYVNNPKTLTTFFSKSILDGLNISLLDHFQWYQSSDEGVTWTKVSGATKEDLKVTPTKVGTVYYQLENKLYTAISFFSPTYYSKVASVTTLKDPVNARGISVNVDDNYLYNNLEHAAVTFAHATPDPLDSTGVISWSIDDPSLATIDSTTGQITANTSGKSGTVKVTGTMDNYDGSKPSDTKEVRIGGGLDDQTVDQGKTAIFDLQGKFSAAPNSVVWHKVDSNNKDTVVSSGTSTSYTTPATTPSDDKTHYYAVVTIKQSGTSDQVITTNHAQLNVNIDKTPDVKVTNKMENLTDNDGNTDTALNNVINGDQAKITGTITDSNKYSKLTNGTFRIKLPGNIQNTTLKIDGNTEQYSIKPIDDQSAYITFDGIDFTNSKTHTYELDFESIQDSNLAFNTKVELLGTDSDGNSTSEPYSGDNLLINFTDGSVQLEANDVDFGTLSYENVGKSVDGIVKDNDNLLNVTDNRRDKSARSITLKQDTLFMNGTKKLKAILSFNDGSGNTPTPITEEATTVASSSDDAAIPSVGSKNGQGLELMLSNQAIQTGTYTSTLNWTITDAP